MGVSPLNLTVSRQHHGKSDKISAERIYMLRPIPDIDEDYTFFQNVRYVFTVLLMYLVLWPFLLVDYFKMKGSYK